MPTGASPYANGVLELTLPIPESAKPRRVPVQVGHGEQARITHAKPVKAA